MEKFPDEREPFGRRAGADAIGNDLATILRWFGSQSAAAGRRSGAHGGPGRLPPEPAGTPPLPSDACLPDEIQCAIRTSGSRGIHIGNNSGEFNRFQQKMRGAAEMTRSARTSSQVSTM